MSFEVDFLSSELGLEFLNLGVKGSDLDLVLLSIALDVDADLRLSSKGSDLGGEVDDLLSERVDNSLLIFGSVYVGLVRLPLDVSLLEDLVLSF